MTLRLHVTSRLRVGLSAALVACLLAVSSAQAGELHHVSKTYNGKPFDYTMKLLAERDAYRVYRLTYPSPVVTPFKPNNTIPADYYLPKAVESDGSKRPAVVCLHILNGRFELVRMICSALASRGVPAVMFKLPYYGERSLPGGQRALLARPRLFLGALPQGVEDVRRTVDLLASRPEVDPEHIGLAGISLGGLLGATAAAEDPRIGRAALILAGGDLPKIIDTAAEARELKEFLAMLDSEQRKQFDRTIAAVDPLTHAAALRGRARQGRVLMFNGTEDRVIPKPCAQRLAAALGISDRVEWLEGLGHYTAMAALPEILSKTVDFFAQDLPPRAAIAPAPPKSPTPTMIVSRLLRDVSTLISVEPADERCHLVDLGINAITKDGKPIDASVQLVRGHGRRFRLSVDARRPLAIAAALGDDGTPWLASDGKAVFRGSLGPDQPPPPVDPQYLMKLQVASGAVAGAAMAPSLLDGLVTLQEDKTVENARAVRITLKRDPGDWARLVLKQDGRSPDRLEFEIDGVRGTVVFRAWQINTLAQGPLFAPSVGLPVTEVRRADVQRMFASLFDFAMEKASGPSGVSAGATAGSAGATAGSAGATAGLSSSAYETEGDSPIFAAQKSGQSPGATGVSPVPPAPPLTLVDRVPHGVLARSQGKSFLLVAGTPGEMGTAHGKLLAHQAKRLTDRVLYVVGAGETIRSGRWFMDQMAEIERRTSPHIPKRFFEECDALSRAAGVARRDGRYANLFPERFHCSGIAVRGKATRDGRVLHARVLDYMTEVNLQSCAALVVFMPERRHAWMSLGYAGFLGTVTAMNEKHLAVGEIGGRGEGAWDGMPMSLLLRDVMERASTVGEAVKIIRQTPRTCEYYYVLSDKHRAMVGLYCTPEKVVVLHPGQQHPRLPFIPEDSVIVSGGARAEAASRRIQAAFGKLDAAGMIELITRPVAARSNLHNAVFSPETLDMWFADAGRRGPACDEPYARCNLAQLIEFYRKHKVNPAEP